MGVALEDIRIGTVHHQHFGPFSNAAQVLRQVCQCSREAPLQRQDVRHPRFRSVRTLTVLNLHAQDYKHKR